MKYFLFFILGLGLFACATTEVPLKVDNVVESTTIEKDSLQESKDTIETIDTTDIKKSYQDEIVISSEGSPLRGITKQQQSKVIKKHERNTNLTVVDKSSKNDDDTTKGWIAYSVPEKMTVGKTYSVKVRISKKTSKQNKAILILGDDDAINNSEYNSIATIDDINIYGEMSAELKGDNSDFSIEALSTKNQSIDTVDYTEWEWTIKPKNTGVSPLKLIIRVKELNKDIIVFNKSINIKSNVSVEVGGFFSENWEWFMTTIIIPVFVYFWNRKKKKTKKS